MGISYNTGEVKQFSLIFRATHQKNTSELFPNMYICDCFNHYNVGGTLMMKMPEQTLQKLLKITCSKAKIHYRSYISNYKNKSHGHS